LEVHLFDFNRDIYGRYVEVQFLHKLREEMKFASLELLQQQILQDAERAKFYFEKRHPTK
jgi:riboflavin kinase/FMN adenylyltransferase